MVGLLGIVVFLLTCLHVVYYILPANTVGELRALMDDASLETDGGCSALRIDFSSEEQFNASVAAWKDSAVSAIELINTWKDYDTAVEELDSSIRDKLSASSWFLETAASCWLMAAVFLAYFRLAFTRWPEIEDEYEEGTALVADKEESKEIRICTQIHDACIQRVRSCGMACRDWKPARSYAVEQWELDEEGWALEQQNKEEVVTDAADPKVMAIDVKVRLQKVSSCSSCCSFPEYSPAINLSDISLTSEIAEKLNSKKEDDVNDLREKLTSGATQVKFSNFQSWSRSQKELYQKLATPKNFARCNELQRLTTKLELMERIPQQDASKVYVSHDGWPLDDTRSLASQGVSDNETVFILNKTTCHCCCDALFKCVNKMLATNRWTFFKLLDWFRPEKTTKDSKKKKNNNDIFPVWWTNGLALFLVVGAAVYIRSLYQDSHFIASAALHRFVELQLQSQFGDKFLLWSLLQYTSAVLALLWAVIGISFFYTKSSQSLFTTVKIWMCEWTYARLVQFYINLPFIAFSLHFISPTLLFFAYGYDNMEYVTNSVYQPLKNAVSPVMEAKAALEQRRLGIGDDDDNGGVTFLKSNHTINVAEQTLNDHAASVVGAAAKVHTVFQMFVTAMLSEGSPSIILYMLSNLIALNGISTIWAWFPKQTKKIAKWAKSGMKEDLRVKDMWTEFVQLHLNNTLFWLTDYLVVSWLLMGPEDKLSDESVVTMLVLGLVIMSLGELISKGMYRPEGRAFGIALVAGPLVFNYVTGPQLFNVAVWLTVTGYQDPDQFWEYWSYVVVLVEILKAPQNWKLDMMARRGRARKAKAKKHWSFLDLKKENVKEVVGKMKEEKMHLEETVRSSAKKWRKEATKRRLQRGVFENEEAKVSL